MYFNSENSWNKFTQNQRLCFLFRLEIDKQLGKHTQRHRHSHPQRHGSWFLDLIIAARLLYVQTWQDLQIPRMKEWMAKIELKEIAGLTILIKEKTI